MFYSIIVPVYNRPGEIDELLKSLEFQIYKNFEVIIIEDGSSIPCKSVIEKHLLSFPVKYFYKTNAGPGLARNYGSVQSQGDYLIFLDSDCIVPESYLMEIEKEINSCFVDAFGGPDKAGDSFTLIQKAINYSMTSFFTTGGIRGGKKRLDKFYPRSFNLGVNKKTFEAIGGFSNMRFGEDIDFSIRIFRNGYTCRLFPEAWVYHKRRTDLKKFFKQVYNSGIARITLFKKYPESLKLVHILPALFTIVFCAAPLLLVLTDWYILCIYLFYFLLIFTDSLLKTKSLSIGLLSLVTTFVQLFAYGSGFITAFCKLIVLKRKNFTAFDKTFYK
jgi:glycosyltransferase involved in cell wall biosynthesis